MANANHNPRALQALSQIDCFALDMDGTIYLGDQIFPETLPFLHLLGALQCRSLFVTNNSSRSASAYVQKLQRMGVHATRDQIYTSGDATIKYLLDASSARDIFLLGTQELHDAFHRRGFATRSDEPGFVVLGFDKSFDYTSFDAACRFIRGGVPFIATHPDFNCPMPGGDMLPDCGALAAAITAATDVKPRFMGKPHRQMIDGLLETAETRRDRLAIVGDRLSTDIRAGRDNDILCILVLTGEAKREDLAISPVQPDLVFEDLADLGKTLRQLRRD